MTTIKKLFLAVAFTATVAFSASSTDVQAADLNVNPVTDLQSAEAVAAPTGATTITAQTDASTGSVKFSFAYSGTDARDFDVFLSQDPNAIDLNTPYESAYVNAGSASVSSLQAGTTYYAVVRPYNGYSYNHSQVYGAPSNVFELITCPDGEPVITYAGAVSTNSIQVAWNPVAGAAGYIVNYYRSDLNIDSAATVATADSAVVLSNLDKDCEYNVKVTPYRVSSNNVTALGSGTGNVYNVKVKPTKCTTPIVTSYYNSGNNYYMNTDERKNADGYQYDVYTAYKSKDSKVKTFDVSKYDYYRANLQHRAFKKNNAYKVRVRAYVIDSAGAKQYSEWSGWTYIGNPKTSVKSRNRVITASWAKLKGTNRAVVSISKSKNSGYKKVTTTTKNSVKITKCGKQRLKGGQYYYVTVVLQKKVGKKYVNLDEPYYYQIYISKY